MDDINSIQGKGKSTINEPYFFDSPEQLKETYMSHLSAITIDWNVHNLDMKSREYHRLEQEFILKDKEYNQLKNRVNEIEKALSDTITDDDRSIMDKYI